MAIIKWSLNPLTTQTTQIYLSHPTNTHTHIQTDWLVSHLMGLIGLRADSVKICLSAVDCYEVYFKQKYVHSRNVNWEFILSPIIIVLESCMSAQPQWAFLKTSSKLCCCYIKPFCLSHKFETTFSKQFSLNNFLFVFYCKLTNA